MRELGRFSLPCSVRQAVTLLDAFTADHPAATVRRRGDTLIVEVAEATQGLFDPDPPDGLVLAEGR